MRAARAAKKFGWWSRRAHGQALPELRAHLLRYYDPVLLPRRVRFVDSLPREATGKLMRARLLELFRDAQEPRPCSHERLPAVRRSSRPTTTRARSPSVVESVREHLADVIVVDDGSAEPSAARARRDRRARRSAKCVRREHNGGKGAAVKQGFAAALAHGYTHALQIDADGQHCSADIPRFLEAARAAARSADPGRAAVQLRTLPRRACGGAWSRCSSCISRRAGASSQIRCAAIACIRSAAALACAPRADHMQFDPEIAVRMVWRGVPVRNLSTTASRTSRARRRRLALQAGARQRANLAHALALDDAA